MALALGAAEAKKGTNKRVVGNAIDAGPMIRYHLWLGTQDLGWVKQAT